MLEKENRRMCILDLQGALECTIKSQSLCQKTVPIRDTKTRIAFLTKLFWYKHLSISVTDSVTSTRKLLAVFKAWCVCPLRQPCLGCYSKPNHSTWSLYLIVINNDSGAHQRNTLGLKIFFMSVWHVLLI